MTRPTFAPWWTPWRWCRARRPASLDDDLVTFLGPRQRCRLQRHHYGRHGYGDGFDVRYFDTAREGTP